MSFIRTDHSFIVVKEGSRKFIYSEERKKPERSARPSQTGRKVRERRAVQPLVRWFSRYDRPTCSVFTVKETDKAKLNLIKLVARKIAEDWDELFPFHLVGVSEISEEQKKPHAHLVAFFVMSGEPQPLNVHEEKFLMEEINRWIYLWELNLREHIPSKFVKLRWAQETVVKWRGGFKEEIDYEKQTKTITPVPAIERCNTWPGAIYKVNYAKKRDGANVQSGIAGYAMGYTVKTLVNSAYTDKFVASVGIEDAMKEARAQQEVRVKKKSVVNKMYATYNMKLVSYLAYEAEKQLRYRKPEAVSCWIKHGRVIVETIRDDTFRLASNEYLLIGLELLCRYVKTLDGASLLRRALVKVTRALCQAYTELPTDTLIAMAEERRQAHVWAAVAKKVQKESKCKKVTRSSVARTTRTKEQAG